MNYKNYFDSFDIISGFFCHFSYFCMRVYVTTQFAAATVYDSGISKIQIDGM